MHGRPSHPDLLETHLFLLELSRLNFKSWWICGGSVGRSLFQFVVFSWQIISF
jgi:hypothetical protein